jgi:YidC/Oxa1 family membrane protein insertase
VDRRFLLFVTLSFVLLTANALWNARNAPKQPAVAPGAAAPADAGKAAAGGEEAAADGKAAEADDPGAAPKGAEPETPTAEADAAAGQGAAADNVEADAVVPAEFVTLGSVDPASPYRMLVTITNEGAAVRRIELSNARYLDLHDRGGYLGRLELKAGGEGLLVQAVGAGTPAAEAGLRVGDRIVAAGATATAPLVAAEDLAAALAKTKPKSEFLIDVLREGRKQTLTAKLRRAPLDVIRPESENMRQRGAPLPVDFVESPSFLLTLQQVDNLTIAPKATELAGVDLLTAVWKIVDRSADEVTLERRLPKRGLVVTKRYKLAKVDEADLDDLDAPAFHLTLDVTIANDGAGDAAKAHEVSYRFDGPNGLPIEGWWYATKVSRASGGLRDVIGRNFEFKPDQKNSSKVATGTPQPFNAGSLAYIGVDAQYFAAAILPAKDDPQEEWIASADAVLVGPPVDSRNTRFANLSYRLVSKPASIEPGKKLTHTYTIFAGPKRPALLAKYTAAGNPAYSLNDFVYYGWFGDVAKAMVGLLHIFYGVVRNYGLAIIMLTVLVRGCMFPVSRGQARSMAKLNDLKPEMERIKEKYKGDQQKQAKAMQDLYRKHKVNPLGGCLPALIQLPVFIGLYRGLAVDVELRQMPLFGSWIHWCSNLAAPDMLYDWSRFMPTLITNSLGPYLNLLPLVTIALFLLQQKMFMPEPTNDQAAMQQKVMKYMMIAMAFMFYKVPSGLCLYFIASSLWGIGERKLFPPATGVPVGGPALAVAGGGSRGPAADADAKRAGKNGQSGASRGGKTKRKR